MSETNVKTVKKIKKVVSEPNFIGIDLGKGNDVGTCNGKVVPKVVKKVKKIVKDESIVKSDVVDNSPCDFDDFESCKVEVPSSANVPTVKKVKMCVVEKVDENASVDYGKQIVFTKVTDLDPKLYEEFFTKERFPRNAIFFDFEVYKYDWCVTFYDVMNYKKTVIVNQRKSLLEFYYKNNRNYDNFIFKGIILGMNPKEINDKIVYDGLKGFQISDKFKDIELYAFDCYILGHSLKQYESFLQMEINEDHTPFDIDRLLTNDEWTEILKYNDHDVKSCIEVFKRSPYTYDAHMGLIEMFD